MNRLLIDRALVASIVLIGWEVTSRWKGSYWISSPLLVFERLWAMAMNGDLWFHGRFTLGEAFGGFLIGAIPGCAVAMALRSNRHLRAAISGIAAVGYAVPKTALVPLFILWFGVGPAAKVALVSSAIFFIVFYSTLNGVESVDQRLVSAARVMGASERQILGHIVWPAVVPYVFGGLRVAVPYAIAGAIVGEIISSNRGIGYLAQFGASDFDTTLIFVSLTTVMLIVLSISTLLAKVQRWLLRWQKTQSQETSAVAA